MEAQISTDVDLHPPSSSQDNYRGEILELGIMEGATKKPKDSELYLPEPAHNSSLSSMNFVIALPPYLSSFSSPLCSCGDKKQPWLERSGEEERKGLWHSPTARGGSDEWQVSYQVVILVEDWGL